MFCTVAPRVECSFLYSRLSYSFRTDGKDSVGLRESTVDIVHDSWSACEGKCERARLLLAAICCLRLALTALFWARHHRTHVLLFTTKVFHTCSQEDCVKLEHCSSGILCECMLLPVVLRALKLYSLHRTSVLARVVSCKHGVPVAAVDPCCRTAHL